MENIPLVDLKAQYLTIKDDMDAAIQSVIDKTTFILGEEVNDFEKEFAKFCGAKYCVGLASGTSALHLALIALGVGKGDEVITTPFTFIATAEAISHCGAKPIFVDIDQENFNIDVKKIEAAITKHTKAIIPVHIYGQTADMDPILEIACKYNLKVIEDAAQAHGAEYKGKRTGTLGDISCFSFYPGKNLGAYGDAGAIVTNNEVIASKIRLLRDHGRQNKYEHMVVGYGERLDSMQAAILRIKLQHLSEWNESRRMLAHNYDQKLQGKDLKIPKEMIYSHHIYHQYVIRTERRDSMLTFLKNKGINAGVHYPIPLHMQPAYSNLGYHKGSFPLAEKASLEVLSLPIYPELNDSQFEFVIDSIYKFTRD